MQREAGEHLGHKLDVVEGRIVAFLDTAGDQWQSSSTENAELSTNNLEKAGFANDPMYLVHRHLDLRPPAATPSMQLSPLRSSSTSAFRSFWTAQQALSSLSARCSILQRNIQIFVRDVPGFKTVLLSVSLDETIGLLKYLLQEKIGTFEVEFNLTFQGRTLLESTLVRNSGVGPLATLTCISVRPNRFYEDRITEPYTSIEEDQIAVKSYVVETSDGQTWTLPNSDALQLYPTLPAKILRTVENLKQEIKLEKGIKLSEQRLFFEGRELADSEMLTTEMKKINLKRRETPTARLSELKPRRPADRAYNKGDFRDLVQQVQELAAHVNSLDTSMEDNTEPTVDNEIILEGGIAESGSLPELVHSKNDRVTSSADLLLDDYDEFLKGRKYSSKNSKLPYNAIKEPNRYTRRLKAQNEPWKNNPEFQPKLMEKIEEEEEVSTLSPPADLPTKESQEAREETDLVHQPIDHYSGAIVYLENDPTRYERKCLTRNEGTSGPCRTDLDENQPAQSEDSDRTSATIQTIKINVGSLVDQQAETRESLEITQLSDLTTDQQAVPNEQSQIRASPCVSPEKGMDVDHAATKPRMIDASNISKCSKHSKRTKHCASPAVRWATRLAATRETSATGPFIQTVVSTEFTRFTTSSIAIQKLRET